MAFGRKSGGGRRAAVRKAVHLPSTVLGIASSKTATLLDVSKAGAQLLISSMPPDGKDVLLRIAGIERVGRVVWRDDEKFGIEFDEPLSGLELYQVQELAYTPTPPGLTKEEKLIYRDWQIGLMR
ncbi:PilZ domain-containing protein [Sphingomonas arenae]|uniref:PilZ domain-containing protein n=1 Tax=Sphingomonas arenae TaxID=2812555 RepID=UPI001F28922B|nr:PilZ domain-containing protein [Sphingomonas arenae]